MTPKEKAQELVDKFYQKQCDVLLKSGTVPLDEVEYEISKQCALIAVDEVLSTLSPWAGDDNARIYWHEVKSEIEKK